MHQKTRVQLRLEGRNCFNQKSTKFRLFDRLFSSFALVTLLVTPKKNEKWFSYTVKPPYSGHPFQRTPLYKGRFSGERMKWRSSSHNKISMQRTLKSGHVSIASITFWSQFTSPSRSDLSIADTPKSRPYKTFLA